MNVDVYDPWADADEVKHEYKLDIINRERAPDLEEYSAVILAVAHQKFAGMNLKKSDNQVIYDVKSILPKENVDARL